MCGDSSNWQGTALAEFKINAKIKLCIDGVPYAGVGLSLF